MTDIIHVGATNRTGGTVSGLYRRPEDSDRWEFCDAITGAHRHAVACG